MPVLRAGLFGGMNAMVEQAPPASAPGVTGSAPSFPYESALSLATRVVPCVAPSATAHDARHALHGRDFDSVSHVVVLDQDHFVGIVTLEKLLAAKGHFFVHEIMDATPPRVAPGTDQEVAALQAVEHGESALAVVDADNRFLGMIPPHRLLAVLLQEHEEDLSRLGGFLKSTRQARRSGEESVLRRFWHRMPWLLVGILGALAAADIVSWFEVQLSTVVMLAFFVPGVVYLADAVGTQTETVVVRALSVGVSLRSMVLREVLTGFAIGIAVAFVSWLLIWWRWGDPRLAMAVGIALFFACAIASAVAMLLPWLLVRFGLDPAFGAGPLATVIQDLLSIVIYFVVVSLIVI